MHEDGLEPAGLTDPLVLLSGGLGIEADEAIGAVEAGASSLGDLTATEVQAIQNLVNKAGRPLEIVGSAARGARTAASDIDYVIPPSSLKHFEGLEGQLPGIDPSHGIIPGVGSPSMGPVIRFEPNIFP